MSFGMPQRKLELLLMDIAFALEILHVQGSMGYADFYYCNSSMRIQIHVVYGHRVWALEPLIGRQIAPFIVGTGFQVESPVVVLPDIISGWIRKILLKKDKNQLCCQNRVQCFTYKPDLQQCACTKPFFMNKALPSEEVLTALSGILRMLDAKPNVFLAGAYPIESVKQKYISQSCLFGRNVREYRSVFTNSLTVFGRVTVSGVAEVVCSAESDPWNHDCDIGRQRPPRQALAPNTLLCAGCDSLSLLLDETSPKPALELMSQQKRVLLSRSM
uniref:Protein kinase domain-containing protein n=1 Tax=Romanomermis culicivorax TaxID=13658 RepID=A0A915KGC2_ROMCU